MHARAMLTTGAIGVSLAFAGPALAAPVGPLSGHPHPPAAPHHATGRTTTPAAAGAGPTLYVNGATGSDAGFCTIRALPCRTIQYAINQAPTTAKISVAAGSYPEQLTITNKNLLITGAGKTKTTIDPTALPQTEGTQTPVVSFQGGTADGLSGVTVDGTGVSGSVSCLTGVFLSSATAKLSSDNVVLSSLANASFSCGYGVYAYDSANSATYSLTMSASSVSEYGEVGVYCNGESCNVSGTRVVGYGPTGAGEQYGIYAEDASTATMVSNTVTGNAYTSPGFTGSNYDSAGDDIGLTAYGVGTLLVSKNTVTGNDMGFYGSVNYGSWTITANTFSHATNDTGAAPGSAPVPDGNFVGDGLTLYDVGDVTVDGNTIASNAGRGITLIGTSDSTFSTAANGRGNTISHNSDDGIALSANFNDSSFPYYGLSSDDTFSGNVIDANSGDGIFAGGSSPDGAVQENNTFSDNTMQGNLRWDALDQSTGSGSDGTANAWTSNTCNTSSPAGICTSIAS